MRLVPLLALLPMTAVAAAQTSAARTATATQYAQSVLALESQQSTACPVGFGVRHAGDGGLINVSPTGPKHPERGYRVTFSPGKDRAIAQARITLHGMSGGRVIPAGEKADGGSDVSENFNLSPSSGAKHVFYSTVYTEKITGVEWVELNEITYADGKQWHESADAVCRVAPNGFLLVAGGK